MNLPKRLWKCDGPRWGTLRSGFTLVPKVRPSLPGRHPTPLKALRSRTPNKEQIIYLKATGDVCIPTDQYNHKIPRSFRIESFVLSKSEFQASLWANPRVEASSLSTSSRHASEHQQVNEEGLRSDVRGWDACATLLHLPAVTPPFCWRKGQSLAIGLVEASSRSD